LIAGSHVYTTTTDWSPYALMALRLSDGARVWCRDMPTGFPPEPVAAGHGLLIVIHGHALAAYESGGPPSDCTASLVSRSGHAPQPPAPRLRLTVGRRNLLLGQRTKIVGRLSGLPNPGGRAIRIDVDPWPFDGKFERAARGTTASDGTVAFRYAPRRNAQLRARLIGEPGLVSRPVKVYADFPITVRKRDAGGRRPQLRVRIFAFRSAKIRRRLVFGYLARRTRWRRVARGRWRLGTRTASVKLRYPRGRLRPGDRWLVCTRERKPDAFGRPHPIDPLCGRRTLPR
jgi:hypothetical protein